MRDLTPLTNVCYRGTLVTTHIRQAVVPMAEPADKPRPGKDSTMQKAEETAPARIPVERVQTGVRMEKRMLKVLKAMAEYYECSLGELLEDIVLHSFEGARPFLPE